MPVYYKHTQFGTLPALLFASVIILLAVSGYFSGWHPVAAGVFLVLLISWVLFYSLNVEIRDHFLEIRFGIGMIRKKFELKSIQEAHIVRNHWYDGWGIRSIPNGWLYNVSGLDAIEISMSSGKRYRIGTDQPNELAHAVNEAIKMSA
jgi:hypothetical protein